MSKKIEGATVREVYSQTYYTVQQIRDELINNMLSGNRKVKYSNLPLLAMLDNFDDDVSFGLTRSKSDDISFDRGSVAECALKALLSGRSKVKQAPKRGSDLPRARGEVMRNIFESVGLKSTRDYEIKFSTSYAYGSPTDSKAKDIIVITPNAVFVLTEDEVQKNASGHIITKQPYHTINKPLTEWLLGL